MKLQGEVSTMKTYTTLSIYRENAVDWLSLNRPDSMNAINDDMIRELDDYFLSVSSDTDCRIVVLRGAGKGFCAGLDLVSASDTLTAGVPPEHNPDAPSLSKLMLLMRKCPQPVVALLHGAACGGGFSIALAADIRIAAKSAKMNVAYVNLGLSGCELGTSYFLPQLVGASLANELMMTGKFIFAERAYATGLVSQLVDDDQLESAGKTLVEEMLCLSSIGLRTTKETISRTAAVDDLETAILIEEHGQLACARTAEFEQRIKKLLAAMKSGTPKG